MHAFWMNKVTGTVQGHLPLQEVIISMKKRPGVEENGLAGQIKSIAKLSYTAYQF